MDVIWFAIVSLMLAVYVVLDGFDFGVGIVHRFVARNDTERRIVVAAIGPVWDGNEVWLIASGGLLFMAFPNVYATAFSGFYLALMMLLWLLILRGVSMEFRSLQENALWRNFWDTVFSLASGMLAFVFGAALGNLVRGVPLDAKGLGGMPLFTNLLTGKNPGIFDWYTILVGLFATAALAGHGALYLGWRTPDPVAERSMAWARTIWRVLAPCWLAVTLATAWVQPDILEGLAARPWSILVAATAIGAFFGVHYFLKLRRPLAAFLSSSAYLCGLFATTMIGNYPYWLRSTVDTSYSLTATNSVARSYGLQVALVWWMVGITLAVGYFAYLYRSLRHKVDVDSGEHY
ncbi:MAG: cytochrome d ubiquinol oxidase subunit II [Pirellula sp.]|nr:cytochrome d ubiquinol oxidase subunit II [Pirellula sp.]